MNLKSKFNNRPKFKLLYVFIVLLFTITACKKELYVKEKLDPVLQKRNLEYTKAPQITIVNMHQFKSKVNQAALGNLKKTLLINDAPNKLMSLNLPETFAGFTLQTDSIKMISTNGHTSFVFPVKLNSKRATTFQNLTIDESKDGTFAFITTYTPTKEWVTAWKNGRQGKFDGAVVLTPINLQNNSAAPIPNQSSILKTEKLSSLQPIPKTALVQVCNTVTYYYSIPYNCASGQHGPGDACGLEGSDRAGYANISNTVTTCYEIDNSFPNGGAGGGGGSTSPTPPTDYNPCDDIPMISFHGIRGERLAIAEGTSPCDLAPLPPAPTIAPDVIPADPIMPGQDHKPVNPKDYVKCFDNIPDAGANYKIIVQVEEPIPGTSANYDYVNPWGRGVGHTAITLIKTGNNGSSVTQTIGFYPAGNKFKGPSKIVDNGSEEEGRLESTINMTFSIDQNSFNKIKNVVAEPPSEYQLLGMNCTAFVVSACSTGGIYLPNAYTNVGVSGAGGTSFAMTPGGLGKAMRDLQNDNRVNKSPSKTPKSNGPCTN